VRVVNLRYYSECLAFREIYKLELNRIKVIRTRNSLKPPFKKELKKLGIVSLEKI